MVDFQIPDEALNYLRSLLEQEGETQWQIGDFIAEYWEETLKYVKPDEVREAHAKLIKKMASGTGADPSTLRDRERMSLFFTSADRDAFPMFTYHQFRALRSAGEGWREVAELASDDNWSVAKIRAHIKGEIDPQQEIIEKLDKIEKMARKLMDDENSPSTVREGLILIPSIIQDTKETL